MSGPNEQQENDRESASNFLYSNLSNSGGKLAITDENTLSKLVAARLDLPNSRRLLSSDFKLSVIKRVWEDQLRLKSKITVFWYQKMCFNSFVSLNS